MTTVYEMAKSSFQKSAENARLSRSVSTTKHEKARLVHMLNDPQFASYWRSTKLPLSRTALDAQSHGSDDVRARADPWQNLSEQFTSNLLTYKNNVLLLDEDTGSPLEPLQMVNLFDSSTSAHLEVPLTFSFCKGLNPNLFENTRDADWLQTQVKLIESDLALLAKSYWRSGRQSNKNFFEEWTTFVQQSQKASEVLAYCGTFGEGFVVPYKEFRQIPPDDGGVGGGGSDDTPETRKRKFEDNEVYKRLTAKGRLQKKLSGEDKLAYDNACKRLGRDIEDFSKCRTAGNQEKENTGLEVFATAYSQAEKEKAEKRHNVGTLKVVTEAKINAANSVLKNAETLAPELVTKAEDTLSNILDMKLPL